MCIRDSRLICVFRVHGAWPGPRWSKRAPVRSPTVSYTHLVFEVFGLIFHPVFEMLRQVIPAVMMEQLRNAAFDWGYVGQCWLVGLVWFAAATALGLGLFRKKEIR